MNDQAFMSWLKRTKTIVWLIVWGSFCIILAFSCHANTDNARDKAERWTKATAQLLTVTPLISRQGTTTHTSYAITVRFETPKGVVENKNVLSQPPQSESVVIYYDPANPWGYIDTEERIQAELSGSYQNQSVALFSLGVILFSVVIWLLYTRWNDHQAAIDQEQYQPDDQCPVDMPRGAA